jgi:hypothetical protein
MTMKSLLFISLLLFSCSFWFLRVANFFCWFLNKKNPVEATSIAATRQLITDFRKMNPS